LGDLVHKTRNEAPIPGEATGSTVVEV